ncbi:cation diffusion facilitator family transporter, partial [Faecalibacterium prausnitzii]
DKNDNLNIRSAFIHVLGDLLGSIGAIVAGLLIWLFGWNIADPIASVLVSVLIMISGWRIVKDSIHILMEGRPSNIDLQEVKNQ